MEPRKRYLDPLALAMILMPLIPLAWDTWGAHYYRQGLRNEPMSLVAGVMAVAIVTAFAIAILLVRTWHLHKEGDSRATPCWLMFILALMAWPAVMVFHPRPVVIYERGLIDWARTKVNVEAIRGWRMLNNVDPPPWPLEQLAPDHVRQVDHGTLLQWGQYSPRLSGRQRKLIVGDDASSQPPDEGRDFWRAVSPGVYVGVHGNR